MRGTTNALLVGCFILICFTGCASHGDKRTAAASHNHVTKSYEYFYGGSSDAELEHRVNMINYHYCVFTGICND